MARGGKRDGAGRKKGQPNTGRKGRSADELRNQMVVAGPRVDHDEAEAIEGEFVEEGHEQKKKREDYVDPVEFCQAVINGDGDVLAKCGILRAPDMEEKLLAARIAVQYTNKKKPVDVNHKHEVSWADEITEAENRVNSLRMGKDDVAAKTTH